MFPKIEVPGNMISAEYYPRNAVFVRASRVTKDMSIVFGAKKLDGRHLLRGAQKPG
jgi:hypothetical protein